MVSDESTEERLEKAMELAMVALASVATTGNDSDKVKAATALADLVVNQWEVRRKAAITASVLPLFEAVSRNLAGTLTDGDLYCPAYELDTAAQSNLILQGLTRNSGRKQRPSSTNPSGSYSHESRR